MPVGKSRQEAQAEHLIRSFNAHEGDLLVDTAPNPIADGEITFPVEYAYAKNRILIREEYLDRVRAIVAQLCTEREQPGQNLIAEPVIPGLYRLKLPKLDQVPGRPELPDLTVPYVLRTIRRGRRNERREWEIEGLGARAAGPDHVVSIASNPHPPSGTGGGCPAKEPEPVRPHTPLDPGPTLDCNAGRGVRIVVIDTGLDQDAVKTHPWLRGVTGEPDPGITTDPKGDRHLASYAGHGTFIAGVIRTVAPEAEVHVRADFTIAGGIFLSGLLKALERVLAREQPDIISMSAGVWDDIAGGPVGFQVFYETLLRHHKGVAVVVAAGNDGSRRQFWPAASPWTVSVGALRPDWRQRAQFSNFGSWVDVYAPGEDLVNAFPAGHYVYAEPHAPAKEATFTGLAKWSGTSFSAPMVAGLIAARMSRTGENGVTAAAALLKIAQAQAQLGTGAVLLPS